MGRSSGGAVTGAARRPGGWGARREVCVSPPRARRWGWLLGWVPGCGSRRPVLPRPEPLTARLAVGGSLPRSLRRNGPRQARDASVIPAQRDTDRLQFQLQLQGRDPDATVSIQGPLQTNTVLFFFYFLRRVPSPRLGLRVLTLLFTHRHHQPSNQLECEATVWGWEDGRVSCHARPIDNDVQFVPPS